MNKSFWEIGRVLPYLLLLFILTTLINYKVTGQACDASTPSHVANLTGNPDSIWLSPPTVRSGSACCGNKNPDRCVEFWITLDSGAEGINFSIASGAIPNGAMFYQVNCGPAVAVGTPLCVSGTGPFRITFCKPGNNENVYQITSIAKPSVDATVTVSDGCTSTINTSGYQPATITWNSISPGAPGQYNSYLSCTSGCASTVATYQPGAPASVTYEVSGVPIGGCSNMPILTQTTVNFVSTLAVSISPLNPTICFGGTATTLTANPTGGAPPYIYTWSNGGNTQSVDANAAGVWSVSVRDGTSCPAASANVTVTAYSLPILANAGPDKVSCANNSNAVLNGSVQMATGGIWSGGAGTYSPSNTSLTPTYTPTAAEITTGTVTHTLTTTGNGTCPSHNDQVTLTIAKTPIVSAGGPQTVCGNNAATTLAGSVTNAGGGRWSGGTGTFFPNDSTLNAIYTPSAAEILAGTVTLTLTSIQNGTCTPVTSQVTITIQAAPTANAGSDVTVCANNNIATVTGTATNFTSLVWSGGAGTYSPNNSTQAITYTPTAAEITAGTVTLTLTASKNLCNPVSDNMIITINPAPTVNAGIDRTVCGNNAAVTLNGAVTLATGGTWSGGAGTFNLNPSTLNATYTPTATEVTNGSVTLTLTTTGNGLCNAVQDQMLITYTATPTVNAGANQSVCGNNPGVTLNGSVTVATGGTWTGGGVFSPNANTLNATYTPSAAEILAGTATLTLTTTGNGLCNPVQDQMIITITNTPTVNAGVDQTVCANRPNVTLNGSVTVATGGTWSGGAGTFNANANTLNATYTPTATEITNGTVTLTLTTTGNGLCNPVQDQMTITITPAPTVNAGADQSICANNATATLNGSVTIATGGTWTGGAGTFTPDANTLNATYKPTAAEITTGFVNLTLTTTGNGLCNAVQDQVRITVTPPPTASANINQTVCANNANVTLSGSVTIATGGTWTTGAGTFLPDRNTLNATYVPTALEKTTGVVALILETTGNGNCLPVTDTMLVIISPAPVSNAGPDRTVCANNPAVSLGGSIFNASGSSWSGGNGTFLPNNSSPTATYTPTSAEITAGTVTLTLTASRAPLCTNVTDQMTITITPAPTVTAGPDQSVCGNNASTTLAGVITVATGADWTTSGTGSFNPNATTLNATYVPSSADTTAGTVTLTLTTTGNGTCLAVNDQMQITITDAPSVNAGPDQTVCGNRSTVTLAGTKSVATGVTWSGGTGLFNPGNTSLTPNYTPSAAEVTAGTATLTLTTTGNGSCTAVQDQMTITITPAPTVNAGADFNVCANNPNISLNGAVTVATGGVWTGGTGLYNPNNTTLATVYTPTATEIANGTVTLTLTSTGNGQCNQVSDNITITITPAPTVNAGADQGVCGNTSGVPLNGAITVATGGTWTTNGTGSFNPNATTLNASYVPTVADTTVGVVTLTLTSTGNGNCIAVIDQMTITFSDVPFSNAGPDQTVCTNDFPAQLNGNATTSTWVGGAGTFTPNRNVLNPTYTPTAGEVTTGSVVLTLQTTAIGACPSVSDNITLTLPVGPTVSAGVDQTVCADNNSIPLTGSVLNAGGGQWTTTGTGSFNPNATTLGASYVPSAADKTSGSVTLTLTSTGNGACSPVADAMVLTIVPQPTIDAGPDQTFCADINTISLNGFVTVASGGVWSGGSGAVAFSPNTTTLNATYTPTLAEKTSGVPLTLTLTSTGNGLCNAVADNITFTFTPAPTVSADVDQTICADLASTPLNGTFTVASGIQWTTSGTGTFSPNSTTQNASYFPSAADTTAGSVTLTIATTGNGTCNPVTDQMILTILPAPVVNAGPDQTVCKDISLMALSGMVANAGGGTWTSSGTGSFNPNNTTLNASYDPSSADSTAGAVSLTLTSTGNGTCNQVSDQMFVTLTPAPTVDAGLNQTICADNPVATVTATIAIATGVTWSSSGTGTFNNPANITSTYTGTDADTTAHSVTFTVTTTGNGTCNPVMDNVTISIVPTPEVNAGPDQTVCGDIASAALNGAVYHATGGIWSGGNGTFSPNNATLNAVYIPTATERLGSSVTLTLTSSGNGSCNPVSDQVTITITPAPTVNAGADQVVCADTGTVDITGIVTIATGGSWTSSGTGAFGDPNNTTTTYTPSATDITNGAVVLTLTSTGNGTCNAVSDQQTITITPAPTVNAGPDQTICAEAASVVLNGTITTATGGSWTTAGSGIFIPNSSTVDPNYDPSDADTTARTVTLTLTTTGNGTCHAYSDDMTITINPVPVVTAGPDVTICADATSVLLNGSSIVNAAGGQWTSTGSGTFIPNAFDINATYAPSVADKAAGNITLTLTSVGNGLCSAVSDQMTITITPAPTVNAGPDQTVCATTAGIILNGVITVATGGTWTTASGAGTFTPDANTLNATFIPAASQIAAGVAILRLTTTGNGTCNTYSDEMRITITPAPTVNAGANQTVCASLATINLSGTVTTATGGIWATSGTGTFANANALATTYTPSNADKTAGNITLTLTSTGNGPCAAVSRNVTIGFQAIPAVDAGPPMLCTNMSGITLSGTVTNATGGRWTTSGTGTYSPSQNILGPKYTPSAADQVAGTIKLYFTSTGNGPCVAAVDSITLGIQLDPSASAGPDQIVCADTAQVNLNGVIMNAAGATWTSSGGGAFTPNSTTLNAAYTPSAIDIINGSVTLTLTTVPNGFCSPVSDQMTIIITPAPTVNAGTDETACSDIASLNLSGSVTIATGGTWTTSGTGTFATINALATTYTPSAADTTAGTVTLTLTTTGNGSCKAKTDTKLITLTDAPTVYAGADLTICADVDIVAFTATITTATGVTWTRVGTGTFDNDNTITTQYTLSAADKTSGLVRVIATTTGNGTCNPVKDTVLLTITPAPTVDATAGNACADADTIQLGGVITVATGAGWTTTGTGTFVPDTSTLNARYVPSLADKTAGGVKLYLTTTGNGTCNAVVDSVILNIQPSPEADAGPDQTVCADIGTVTLAGSTLNAGGGIWSTIAGTGTFTPSNIIVNGGYTLSASDTAAHSVTLVLTTTGNGSCSAVTDTMEITILPAPTVNAGPAIVCANGGVINLTGTYSIAGGVQWTTDGDGLFGDPTSDTTTYTISPNDILAGSVHLTLETTGNGLCNAVSDMITVNIASAPTVDAGDDDTLCADITNLSLSASQTFAGGVVWSTINGDGTIVAPNSNNTTYNVTVADTTRGFVTFVVETTANGICLPVTDTVVYRLTDAPTVDAGPANVCSNAPPVVLNGSMTVATGGVWTRSGDGVFGNANMLSTTYTPGATDIATGSVTLRLTTNAGLGTCNPVFDEIILYITDAPQANADTDETICADSSGIELNGSVIGALGLEWTTSGTGTFTPDAFTPNAVYVPSDADTTAGSVILTVTTTGVGSCNPVSDNMTLTINPVPVVNAGPDQTVCADIALVTMAGSVAHTAGGNWTIFSGSGALTNANVLNTTYNPSDPDTTAGAVTMVLTSTGMGSCKAVTDTVTITITDAPSVDAGPALICSDAVSIPLQGIKTTATGVQWSTSGNGAFAPNNVSLTTNYIPSANDRAVGSIILTLTTTGNGTCIPVQDNIQLELRPGPIANAGGDQGICADAGTVTLTAAVTNAGGGQWSTLGSGSFNNEFALNSIYTMSDADTLARQVTLVLTTTGVAPCNAVTDTVIIDITPAPVAVVNAGNDTTVCADNPDIPLKGTIANAAGGMWTSSGDGIFTPNAFTLNATYLPSANDITNGGITLTLESTGNGICNPIIDNMVVTINPRPTADAGIDETVCADVAGINLNAIITTATQVEWFTSGSGSFTPDEFAANATYVPSDQDTADAFVVLTVTTLDNGACSAAFDNKAITITPAPVVNAGFNQTICADADSINVSGMVFIATGGLWTSNGTGSFTNDDSLNTYYHPSPGDTTMGTIILTLSSTGNGTCNIVSDNITLTITDAPQIDAGPDQNICADQQGINLDGTVTVANGIEWIGSGTGTYSPDYTTLDLAYFTSDADTAAGSLTFILRTTATGTCNPVADTMSVTINPIPVVNAGPDMTVCADIGNVGLNGVVANATGGTWATSGTGSFPDATLLNGVYVPSAIDTTNGLVILNLTSTGNGVCNQVFDILRIVITPAPTVNAGSDQTVCADIDTIDISGSISIAAGGRWTTSGSGSFAEDSSLTTQYIISAADKTSGSVYLRLTTYGNGTCNPVVDSMRLIITPRPVVTITEPDPKSICADAANVTFTANITVATGGTWTTTGTGSFAPNANTVNVTYIPSATDRTTGLISLTLTSTGNGTCRPVFDETKLRITPAPTVNAGPDQTVCADATEVFVSSTRTVAGGVEWSSSGTGFFNPSEFSAAPGYFLTNADRAAGFVNLTVTTTANGTCMPVSDVMRITITPAPTVNAGPDQTICANTDSLILTGNVTVATGGTWSTLGSGNFSPDPDGLSRSYFPSAGDTTAGTVTLVLTTTGNGTCFPKYDTMHVTINPVPIVNAGGPNICSDETGVTLSGFVYNAAGGMWTTSGSGTFSPSPATLNARYYPSPADVASGLVTLTLTSTGNGPCGAVSGFLNVTITPLPVPDAGADQRICRYASTVLVAGSTPDVTYEWFTLDGVSISNDFIANIQANSDTSFVLTVMDSKRCSVNDTVTVFVVDPPTFNLNPYYCFAFGTPLDAAPVPIPVDGTFQWYRNDTIQHGENATSIMVETVGEHVISYNYGSCTVFDTTEIEPLPVLTGLDKYACVSTGTIISTTNIAGATFAWTSGGVGIPVNNDSISVTTSAVDWDSTQYIVTVTDVLGCQNNDTIYTIAVPPPVLTLETIPSCEGLTATLNAEPSNISELLYGFLTNYQWSKDGSVMPGSITPTITVNTTGSYSAIFSIGECRAFDTSVVTFYPLPTISNEPSTVYCDETDLTVDLDAGPGTSYQWLNTADFAADTNQTVTVDVPGYYYVEIYNEYNCYRTDSIYAKDACPPRLFVPQGFTPDVEGESSTFRVFGAYFKNFEITIYNRWGEIIFYSNDKDVGWDGTYRGEKMPPGVYPYVITYEAEHSEFQDRKTIDGAVILVR